MPQFFWNLLSMQYGKVLLLSHFVSAFHTYLLPDKSI
jgi:hypothetical protein